TELRRLRKRYVSWSVCGAGLRHFLTDRDTDCRISASATIIEIASKPAFAFISVRVRSGLPDFCRTEMRSVRVGITNALHDAQVTLVEERFQSGKFGVQSRVRIELQNFVCGQPKLRP